MAIFFCGMKKSQYFKNRVKSLFYKFIKFIFKIVGKNKNTWYNVFKRRKAGSKYEN